MLIGYARTSTKAQKLDRQIAALISAGVDNKNIFREQASGKTGSKRPVLDKAIDALGTDYILVIAEWDRATRSMLDGLDIIRRVAERNATIWVLDKPRLDLRDKVNQGILGLLSAMAEEERDRITKRAQEGRTLAIERGVKFGPKYKLSDHQRQRALERKAAGERLDDIAADFGVHKSTISRL